MRKKPFRPANPNLANLRRQPRLDPTALDTPERIIEFCRSEGYVGGVDGDDGVSTDIERLIEDTPGLTLAYEDLGEFDARIEKLAGENYRIVINARHPKVRQRFSMAHEYAHFQIHRDEIERMPPGEKILHRSEERNRIEYQANAVAAEVLMPERLFIQTAKRVGGDISRIAREFQVSTIAVRYRAKNLGLSGHGF